MKELVGCCTSCNKEVFCLDGFLNGVVTDKKGVILCFDCFHEQEQIEKNDQEIKK
jgi:hypothetical protein